MNSKMIIIGITGEIGAGKGTIVDYFIKEKGFMHFSARAFLIREIAKRGLKANRDTMNLVANDLRETYSPSYIIESLYKNALKLGEDCVIESIRTVGEIDALRTIGNFHLLAVTAPLETRYERIVVRNGSTDHVTFEEFKMQNEREMQSANSNNQNLTSCIAKADFIIHNDGERENLYQKAEVFLNGIMK